MPSAAEKLVVELEQAEKLRRALFKVADLTDSVGSMDQLYAIIQRIISELMYAENFFIVLKDEENNFSCPYFCDVEDLTTLPELLPEDFQRSLTGYVLRTGQPLLAQQSELREMEARGLFRVFGKWMQEWLSVPLVRDGVVLGVLVVQSYKNTACYSERDKDFLIFISHHIAWALTHKWAEQKLQEAGEELESRVEHRTAELIIVNRHLEQQISEKLRIENELKGILIFPRFDGHLEQSG